MKMSPVCSAARLINKRCSFCSCVFVCTTKRAHIRRHVFIAHHYIFRNCVLFTCNTKHSEPGNTSTACIMHTMATMESISQPSHYICTIFSPPLWCSLILCFEAIYIFVMYFKFRERAQLLHNATRTSRCCVIIPPFHYFFGIKTIFQ